MDYLVPLPEAKEIVEQFETGTLPVWAWTHEAHLIVGLSVLTRFGVKNGQKAMRERVIRYNEAVEKVNSDTSGYHETVTFFWLNAIWNRLSKNNTIQFDQETLDALLSNIDLAYRNLFLNYYSEARILSVEARRNYIEPDKFPVDNAENT